MCAFKMYQSIREVRIEYFDDWKVWIPPHRNKSAVKQARKGSGEIANLLRFKVTIYQLETMHMFQCTCDII